MTEPAQPSDPPPLPRGSAADPPGASTAELLSRITAQLGTQLSGLHPPRARPRGRRTDQAGLAASGPHESP